MRRFRIRFLLFTLLLLGPLILLVQRAIQSVTLERAVRHQVVGERVFDEMERALSHFLEPEEVRAFAAYTADSSTTTWPFLIGHFQVDPDGRVQTSTATRTGAGAPNIEDIVARFWRSARRDQPVANAPAVQLPGTTVTVGKDAAADESRTAAQAAPANEGTKQLSAFDALRALNKGASERMERQRKLDADEPEPQINGLVDERDTAAKAPPSRHAESAAEKADLPPMSGQIVDARHLLLYRTVIHGTQGYRQGLVLDVDQLCNWIREQALGHGELVTYATLSCTTPFAPAATDVTSPGFVYQHRFADPFDALTARLVLQPLPGVGSVTYVYALCALLLATGVLGLAALYRMVSVVVRYADQRSNFVAAVSHELKTPLTAIRMYGEMLRDGMVPSEAKREEYYRHITGESERLTRLINNVLELSRLEKGTRQMELTPGSVGPVIREVANLLRPHLHTEGFELAVDVAADLPEVRCERDALVQVLANLVDNAAKYARDAVDRRIELGCHTDGRRVCITVRDHGPGVPAQQLNKIFEPFYRAESELTRRNKGTGIGLALVRGLVERMGAQVGARNRQDGGLEVEISWRIDER